MSGVGVRGLMIAGALVVVGAISAPPLRAQQPAAQVAPSADARVTALLAAAAKDDAVALAYTKRAADFRKRAAVYTQAANRYALVPTTNSAAVAQMSKIQTDQAKLAAVGETLAQRADAAAARATASAVARRQQAAAITPAQ